jgi:uncharacterized protein
MNDDPVADALALLDWRRRIAEVYDRVRTSADQHAAWTEWCEARRTLFREHPQSPIPRSERDRSSRPHMYAHDPAWRALADVKAAEPMRFELATSNSGPMAFTRFARAQFTHGETELSLDLYLLDGYGGGLFVPFADATSAAETYGAGRYLLDTVKGADLGLQDGRLVLDFNFAYQPSCSYDPRWTCPLAPPANRLPVAIRSGERVGLGCQ